MDNYIKTHIERNKLSVEQTRLVFETNKLSVEQTRLVFETNTLDVRDAISMKSSIFLRYTGGSACYE